MTRISMALGQSPTNLCHSVACTLLASWESTEIDNKQYWTLVLIQAPRKL